MSEHYILDEDHNVHPAELMEWARFFVDRPKRRVALDTVGDIRVSTVFLGLDHSFGDGPPLLFETLATGGPVEEEIWRYSTWDEAVAGHRDAVKLMELLAKDADQSGRAL